MAKYSDALNHDWGLVIPELALSMGSGMLNETAKGFTGLLAGALHGADAADDLVSNWDDSFVYKPRTKGAKAAMSGIGKVMGKIEEGAEWLGDAAEAAGAPPALSTAVYSFVMLIPDLVGLKIGKKIKESTKGTNVENPKEMQTLYKHEVDYWLNVVKDPHYIENMWRNADPVGYQKAVKDGTVKETVEIFSKELSKKLESIDVEVVTSPERLAELQEKGAIPGDVPAGGWGSGPGGHKKDALGKVYLFPRHIKSPSVRATIAGERRSQTLSIDETFRHETTHGFDEALFRVLREKDGGRLGNGPINLEGGSPMLSTLFPSIAKVSYMFDELIASDLESLGRFDIDTLRNPDGPTALKIERSNYISDPPELYARLQALQRYMKENNLTMREILDRYEGGTAAEPYSPKLADYGGMNLIDTQIATPQGGMLKGETPKAAFERFDLPTDIIEIIKPLLEYRDLLNSRMLREAAHKMDAPDSSGGGLSTLESRLPENHKKHIKMAATNKVFDEVVANALREIGTAYQNPLTTKTYGVGPESLAVEAAKSNPNDEE
jgi:hypothetical protein